MIVLLAHATEFALRFLQLFVDMRNATGLVISAAFMQVENTFLLTELLKLTLSLMHLRDKRSLRAF